MEVLTGFRLRFRPLPSTFWGRSKNKSCSIACDSPNLEVLACGLEFFRPPKFSLGTHALLARWVDVYPKPCGTLRNFQFVLFLVHALETRYSDHAYAARGTLSGSSSVGLLTLDGVVCARRTGHRRTSFECLGCTCWLRVSPLVGRLVP
ncbi:unnamed protein product [Prunus armeniaca]